MEGIHFVINDKGKKVAVMIDLKRHGQMWEDFYDALAIVERRNDRHIPLAEVKKRLIKAGKLRG